jgi:hypothetical protein
MQLRSDAMVPLQPPPVRMLLQDQAQVDNGKLAPQGGGRHSLEVVVKEPFACVGRRRAGQRIEKRVPFSLRKFAGTAYNSGDLGSPILPRPGASRAFSFPVLITLVLAAPYRRGQPTTPQGLAA